MSKFIVIEGLDGAGKSTQLKMLLERCDLENIKYKFVHFPRTEEQGVYGTMISQYLRGDFGSLDSVHPQLVALIFALDRVEFADQIRQWMNDGYMVIADRYVYSNIAFQCAKLSTSEEKEILSKWILDFEYEYHKIPTPTVSMYLDVPFEFIKKSLENNREGNARAYLEGKEDIHENDLSFQDKVRREYERMVSFSSDFKKIKCTANDGNMMQTDEIHKGIWEEINLHS
jgi:dTMP kinase